MEKIRMNDFRLLLVAIPMIAIDIFLLDQADEHSLKIFLNIIVMMSIALFGSFLVHKYSKTGLFFSKEGIHWIHGKKSTSKNWSDVRVETKINFPLFKLYSLSMNCSGRNASILICWITEENLIDLTRKFVPHDHKLRKVVKIYSDRRGLKL